MPVKPKDPVRYLGYTPGDVGRITEAHAVYYHENWGFDLSFETQVAGELSAFLMDVQPDREGLWIANFGGRFVGSVAITDTGSDDARLRWFIVIPPYQGRGIGHTLIQKAVAFSRSSGYRRIYLWTFEGLDRARKLYEKCGFSFGQENVVKQWGQVIKEQRFDLVLR